MYLRDVVFLHALPLDSRMWSKQLASVAPLPTLAPDLYRLGNSLDEWSDGVVDEIDGDEVILVGCSIGGSCALHIAERRPDQIAGVVLVGANVVNVVGPAVQRRLRPFDRGLCSFNHTRANSPSPSIDCCEPPFIPSWNLEMSTGRRAVRGGSRRAARASICAA